MYKFLIDKESNEEKVKSPFFKEASIIINGSITTLFDTVRRDIYDSVIEE